MTLPAIVRTTCSLGRYSIHRMILLMTTHTPAHRERLAAASDRHRLHVTMAIATHLLHRLALLKIKTLDMAFMIEAHEVGKIMHLLPRDRLLGFPILKQFLDAGCFLYRLNALMAADTLLQRRNTRRHAAPRISVAIHAIDLHATLGSVAGMAIMGKLNRLIDLRTQIISGGKRLNDIGSIAAGRNKQHGK